MSCSVGHRHGLDPVLLRLWCRPIAAAATRPLAWEVPYARSPVLKRPKKKKKKPFLFVPNVLVLGRDFLKSLAKTIHYIYFPCVHISCCLIFFKAILLGPYIFVTIISFWLIVYLYILSLFISHDLQNTYGVLVVAQQKRT